MLRVAHIVWGFTAGGIETMLVDIIAEQVNSAEVALFVVNDKVDTDLLDTLDKRCKVFRIHRKEGSRNPIPLIRFNRALCSYDPDIVHYHYTGLIKLTFNRKPKVITIHNTHSESDDIGRYDAVYAISDAVRVSVMARGFDAVTVENGIKAGEIVPRVASGGQGGMKFVQVGRLFHQHKGQDIMIEALNILVHKKGIKDFTMDFIGDGESRRHLEEMVDCYSLKDNIRFLGNQTRKYIYENLKNYDLCFQPSLSEGFGLTVIEAMAAKVPVIVSDIPGTMEAIGNGRYGFCFPPGNAQALADKITDVMASYNSIAYLDEAREYVVDNFDISHTAQRYLLEYQRVIKKC